MMLIGAAAVLGSAVAYADGWCEDCEPCVCLPDGSYGLCCYGPYQC